MLIGRLAAKSGFSRDTIRYYEKLGLIQIDNIGRHANNYKDYPLQTVQRLKQISELKAIGFTLTEIVEMLNNFDQSSQPCVELPAKLNDKITLISEKILCLEKYKHALLKIKKSCDGECKINNGFPNCISSR